MIDRTPQFLGLVQRVQDAFATLRDVRLTLSELRRMVPLDDDLCRLIEANQPSGAGRWGGYATDEQLVTDWTSAVTALLVDGDALLPGDSYKIDRGNGGKPPSSSPDRGGHRGSPPRKRAQGAVSPPRRPARQKRAAGQRTRGRAGRPTRNPAAGP